MDEGPSSATDEAKQPKGTCELQGYVFAHRLHMYRHCNQYLVNLPNKLNMILLH